MPERHYSDILISQVFPGKLPAELAPWADTSLEASAADPEFWRALNGARQEFRPILAIVLSSATARKAAEAAIIVS